MLLHTVSQGQVFFRSLAGRSRSIPGPIYNLEAGGETAIRLKSSYHKTTLLGFNYAAILYDQHLHATVAPLRFYLRLKCLPCLICSNFEVLSHTDLCWPPQKAFLCTELRRWWFRELLSQLQQCSRERF